MKNYLRISIIITLFLATVTNLTANTNVLHQLGDNEEFVYGTIGLDDDGNQKYTFIVVRVPAPDKTIYRRELDAYMGVQPLLRGGTMSVDNNVKDYDLYDYYIVFNGQRLGPFDRFKDLQQENPNIDDWISPGGKGLTFTTVKGQRYTAMANNRPVTTYWSHVQVPGIAEAPGKIAFYIEFDRNEWNLTENYGIVHRGWRRFSNMEYSKDGSKLLYVGTQEDLSERYVYINHEQVAGPYSTVMPYVTGFVGDTNIPYYLGIIRKSAGGQTTSEFELTVGSTKVNLPQKVQNIGRIHELHGILAFTGKINDKDYTFLYNVNANSLQQVEGAIVHSTMFIHDNQAYFAIRDAQGSMHLITEEGKSLSSVQSRNISNSLRTVNFQICSKGSIYAYYVNSNDKGVVLKNGQPYNLAGSNFSGIRHFSINPVTGRPQIALSVDKRIGTTKRRIIHNDKAIDIQGEMDNFERFSYFPPEGSFYWVKRVIHERNDWRWQLYRENEVLTEEFHGIAALSVSNNGERFAALVSRDPEINATRYLSTNEYMHKPMELMVDGRIIDGRFGAPIWSQKSNRFLVIAQEGRRVVIKQL